MILENIDIAIYLSFHDRIAFVNHGVGPKVEDTFIRNELWNLEIYPKDHRFDHC